MHDHRHSIPAIAVLTTLVFFTAAPGVSAADPGVPMIVVLARDADVDEAVERGRRKHGAKPDNVFRFAARGYAAKLTRAQARAFHRTTGSYAMTAPGDFRTTLMVLRSLPTSFGEERTEP